MPNWVYNDLTISGTKEDVAGLLATIARNRKVDTTSFEDFVNLLVGDNDICMSDFEKESFPETFLKYDTTNHPDGMGLELGKNEHWDNSGRVVTEELIEEFKKATAEQREKYGCVGWYDYNRRHLGCKWNASVEIGFIRENSISLTVNTPWSLPVPWLERISSDFHLTVSDEYSEEFNNFGPGRLCYEDGELTADEVRTIYFVFGEKYDEDERENALDVLRTATGLDVPADVKDSELCSEEWSGKFDAWQKALPDGDDRKAWSVFHVLNPVD